MSKKILNFVYLPDTLINIGVWVLAYFSMIPPAKRGLVLPDFSWTDYFINQKMLGIVMITIGINIVIRRYLNKKPA